MTGPLTGAFKGATPRHLTGVSTVVTGPWQEAVAGRDTEYRCWRTRVARVSSHYSLYPGHPVDTYSENSLLINIIPGIIFGVWVLKTLRKP